MNTTDLRLRLPPPFDFRSTAYSHGWVVLAPNRWDNGAEAVDTVLRLSSGEVVNIRLWGTGTNDKPGARIQVTHSGELGRADRKEIKAAVSRMLRTDEDFTDFYTLCEQQGEPWVHLTAGRGRLLRSPTLFEDVIKTICTTNIHWGGTKSMVRNLVQSLGDPFPGGDSLRAFPTPEAIAGADPASLAEARLGYRAAYIQTFAGSVAAGELNLAWLEDPNLPTADLRKELLGIKGVGNYAAHTLLMLLGRYEHLAFDTAMRDFVAQKYNAGQAPDEKEAYKIYDGWGKWKFLAYWFDIYSDD